MNCAVPVPVRFLEKKISSGFDSDSKITKIWVSVSFRFSKKTEISVSVYFRFLKNEKLVSSLVSYKCEKIWFCFDSFKNITSVN
jgi:hypothetical protein